MAVKNVIHRNLFDPGNPESIAKLQNKLKKQAIEVAKLKDALPVIAREMQYAVLNPMLALLRVYPARQIGMKMRWKSEKQKRYVLMKLRKEKNLPYKRTMGLARGWTATARVNPNTGSLQITTANLATSRDARGRRVKFARYVIGDIGLGKSERSIRRYADPIQPFHQDRGWQPAALTIMRFYDRANEYVLVRLEKKLLQAATKEA